jgi:hypothetical protein
MERRKGEMNCSSHISVQLSSAEAARTRLEIGNVTNQVAQRQYVFLMLDARLPPEKRGKTTTRSNLLE